MVSPKPLILFLLALVIMTPLTVTAQGPVTIETLDIALWPEYDRPQMLVIYRVSLSPDVALPAEISLKIPAAAGEPNAVAERSVDGGLYNLAYDREVHGDWAQITFLATMPETWLEYYDPGLQKDGAARHFEFNWPGDYEVESLSVEVQQPAEAQNMSILPGLGAGVQGNDGFLYHKGEIGSFAPGESFNLTLDYAKTSDATSLEIRDPQPSFPDLNNDTSGRIDLMDAIPWMVALTGVFLILGSAWWLWRGERRPATRRASTRRRERQASSQAETYPPGGNTYCHNCGKRAAAGDRFCRACGTRLRVSED